MKKTLIQIASFTLLVGAVALTPIHSQAQASTNAPAAPKPEKGDVMRFHGKIIAVDKVAMTITVGHSTYEVTSKTKIFNGRAPATLEDGVIGDIASGVYQPEGEKKVVLRMTFRKEAPAEGSAPPETK